MAEISSDSENKQTGRHSQIPDDFYEERTREGSIFSPVVVVGDETRKSLMGTITKSKEEELRRLSRRSSAIIGSLSPSKTPEEGAEPVATVPEDEEVDYEILTQAQQTTTEEYDANYFEPFLLVKSLPPYDEKIYGKKRLLPPKEPTDHSHTLVLDLDETLVCCSLKPIEKPHCEFSITYLGEKYDVYVRFRPYVFYFLETMSKHFEIVVFTASIQPYAEKLCNLLNSQIPSIKFCLNRDHCMEMRVEGGSRIYVKNLHWLDRDLAKTVIVDNSLPAFSYNLANGVLIDSWYEDRNDRELYGLAKLLIKAKEYPDIRVFLKEVFMLEDVIHSLG